MEFECLKTNDHEFQIQADGAEVCRTCGLLATGDQVGDSN